MLNHTFPIPEKYTTFFCTKFTNAQQISIRQLLLVVTLLVITQPFFFNVSQVILLVVAQVVLILTVFCQPSAVLVDCSLFLLFFNLLFIL